MTLFFLVAFSLCVHVCISVGPFNDMCLLAEVQITLLNNRERARGNEGAH